ncbi:MAG TPA: IS1182 family transposase [Methylomirabilota bacterium]|jgi:transposase|nr:IS1182 family transposase [Methylomirabilota bacterium]
MAKTFRPYDREQLRLMPPALADWVPEGHLARFVSDLVDDLDLTAIEDTYAEERGYPPYHPRMMVTVLLYAYCTGTYSSRKIAARLEDSVAFRFLAAENQPDVRTISDFRKRHSAALASLFTQVLRLCRQAGLVRLGRVAIDGTRIKANASKHKAMSYGRMVEKDAALQQEIAELLRRAEQIDRDEDAQHGPDRRGDELPAELARRESRLQKIREAKAALEAEARAQAARAGKDPTQATPSPKAQRNFTDPESKIQKTADGFIQGYNAQAAVDATAQVIVAQDVTPRAADVGHLLPLVAAIGRTLRQRPRQVLADAGYCSEENLQRLAEQAIDPYIATGRQKHTEWQAPAPRGRPPAHLTGRERMARKLRTVKGRAVYACRKAIVEPVFGQIKQARGFRQFLRRGQTAVRHEWALLCTVHNILKLYTASAHA